MKTTDQVIIIHKGVKYTMEMSEKFSYLCSSRGCLLSENGKNCESKSPATLAFCAGNDRDGHLWQCVAVEEK